MLDLFSDMQILYVTAYVEIILHICTCFKSSYLPICKQGMERKFDRLTYKCIVAHTSENHQQVKFTKVHYITLFHFSYYIFIALLRD